MALGDGRRYRGRGVLVTGGSSGIGLAAARRLATEGASVVLVGRTRAKVIAAEKDVRRAVAAEWSGGSDPVPVVASRVADVTDPPPWPRRPRPLWRSPADSTFWSPPSTH